MSAWKAAVFLILAGLSPAPAAAADCYPKQDLDQISDAVMACEKKIGEAADGLASKDPAVRKKAAQAINSAKGVLRAEEAFLNSMAPDKRVTDNKLQIADVRDIHKDELQQAGQIDAGAGGAATKPDKTGGAPLENSPRAGGPGGPGNLGPAGGADNPGAPGGGPGGGDAGGGSGSGGAGGGAAGGASQITGHAADNAPAAPSAAGSHAAALGAALKAGMREDAGGLPGGQGKDLGMRGAGFGAPGGAGKPGAAPGQMSLAAAAASGFGDSFRSLGLKLGPGGQVQRADGTPATPAETAALSQRLASDPQALMRRPDFFAVLPRESFGRLKSDFASGREADGNFRHVAMTEAQRDFVHSQACDKSLETGCNPKAHKAYRKGDFVSPEDLKAIDEALHPDEAASADYAAAAAADAAASASRTTPLSAAAATPDFDADARRPRPRAATGIAARLAALFGRFHGEAPTAAAQEPSPAAAGGAPQRRAGARPSAPAEGQALRVGSFAASAVIALLWLWSRRRKRSFMERG